MVVVSITHRVNAFGFLYLAELGDARYRDARNVCLKDIIADSQAGWNADEPVNTPQPQ